MPIQVRNQELIDLLRSPMTRAAQESGGMDILEGAGIDVITPTSHSATVGLGGDTVLVYHNDLTPVTEYATIADAVAAAAEGDTVILAASMYTENVVLPRAITLVGHGPGSVIQGTVMGFDGATIRELKIVVSGDSEDLLWCVVSPESGILHIEDCQIMATNITGDAAALYSNSSGTINASGCRLGGESTSGSGWAAYCAAGGMAGTLIHCILSYSTTPVGREAT